MKTLIGLLCFFSATHAQASEDFTLNTSLSSTVCQEFNGAQICLVNMEPSSRNVVVPLSECDSHGGGWEICSGKWEGSRNVAGKEIFLKVSVQKSFIPDFGVGATYQLTASLKTESTEWRHLRVTTGAGGALTDSLQLEGEGLKLGVSSTLTPALSIGPANY